MCNQYNDECEVCKCQVSHPGDYRCAYHINFVRCGQLTQQATLCTRWILKGTKCHQHIGITQDNSLKLFMARQHKRG